MARSRTSSFVLALLVVPMVALFFSACGGGAERALIRSFFLASRLNDRPTLNNIAMVAFDPGERGSVSTFSLDNVAEEVSRPLLVRELNEALLEARRVDDEFTAEKVAYQDENFDAINRVLAAERDGESVGRRDTEVQEAWTDWRDRTMEHARLVSEAQVDLTNEQNAAALSMYDQNNPLDLTQYDGELVTKEVSITANLELNGSESERAMVVTLQKAVLTDSDGMMIEGGWVVGAVN